MPLSKLKIKWVGCRVCYWTWNKLHIDLLHWKFLFKVRWYKKLFQYPHPVNISTSLPTLHKWRKLSQTPPAQQSVSIDGNPAVGIAISPSPTGNVVNVAAVKNALTRGHQSLPEGRALTSSRSRLWISHLPIKGFVLISVHSVLTVVCIIFHRVQRLARWWVARTDFSHLRPLICRWWLAASPPANILQPAILSP